MSQHSVCITHCVLMREGSGGGGMSPVFWGAYPCYASLCRSCTIGYSRLCRKYYMLHKISPVFCVLGAPGLVARPASAEARVQHKVPYVAQENTPIQGGLEALYCGTRDDSTHMHTLPCNVQLCMACGPSQQLPG